MVLLLICLPFAYAVYLYSSLPVSIPTHFNLEGQADSYGRRNSIFLAPCILGGASLLVYLLLSNITKIDPKRYQKTDTGLYRNFALFMVAFLGCLSLGILYISSHPGFQFEKFLLPSIGLLLAAIGVFMPRFHQNYFVGLRLPWTLDNEDNWNATHRMAGKVWIAGGICMALTGFLLNKEMAGYFFFIMLIIMIAIPVVFSYNMFKNGNKIN